MKMTVWEWFEQRSFTHRDFCGLAAGDKAGAGARRPTATLIFPTRNVADTIGEILDIIADLRARTGLPDQVIVVDADSPDGTADIARARGAEVYSENELMSGYGPAQGKGDAMWRALTVARGDIVMFADSDTKDFKEHFVTGTLGPLLADPWIQFCKGGFRRPFTQGGKSTPDGGGRVTELMAKPLINHFYPELAGFVQPLGGEFAGRRELLRRVPFFTGYGVEIGMMIDIYKQVGLEGMAQVDLGTRQNRHQPLFGLTRMSSVVLRTLALREGIGPRPSDGAEPGLWDLRQPDTYLHAVATDQGLRLDEYINELVERPPLAQLSAEEVLTRTALRITSPGRPVFAVPVGPPMETANAALVAAASSGVQVYITPAKGLPGETPDHVSMAPAGRASANEFDHVVVGAGSAGCVISRRLVDAGRSVALVEAGGPDDNPAIHDPGRSWELWNSPEDYAFVTEPQEHAAKTSVCWPRGKVVGGSSSLNGMIYVRGARADYDNWAYNGAAGWSYADVLPYFLKSEDFEDGPSEYHGAGGPLPVTRNHDPNPATLAFLDACAGYGIPLNDDCNGADVFGAGLCQLTIRNGRRASAWASFALPVAGDPRLTLITGTQAVRLTVSRGSGGRGGAGEGGGRVAGVVLADGRRLVSNGDVIVSAGVIGSAHLLLLSGIGPADDLLGLGIDPVADLPGVGANLHDHMLATILYESSRTVPPGTSNNLEAHFFAASVPGLPAPDLQPLMSHFPMPVEGYPVPAYGGGYAIVGGVIRPLSRGRLWLRSADPGQAPVLDPHYLEEPADRQALLAAMKLSREIGAGRELEQWRAREIAPGPDVRADAELLEYSMANLITYHHQVGTCKMGIDRMAVTAPDLRVHGVDGLRVADASVMPAVTSGNTNAPTIMIGERCADFVLNP